MRVYLDLDRSFPKRIPLINACSLLLFFKPYEKRQCEDAAKGTGLFATMTLLKGTYVLEYDGEQIDKPEFKQRKAKYDCKAKKVWQNC